MTHLTTERLKEILASFETFHWDINNYEVEYMVKELIAGRAIIDSVEWDREGDDDIQAYFRIRNGGE